MLRLWQDRHRSTTSCLLKGRLLLDRLLAQSGEHEWLEFKHNDDPHTIGEYISALANAAALDGEPCGYMVWGIEDDTRRVLGTRFKPGSAKIGAQMLDMWLHQYLRPKLDFRFEAFDYQGLPVVVRGMGRLFADVSLTAEPLFARWGFGVEARQQVERAGVVLANVRMGKPL